MIQEQAKHQFKTLFQIMNIRDIELEDLNHDLYSDPEETKYGFSINEGEVFVEYCVDKRSYWLVYINNPRIRTSIYQPPESDLIEKANSPLIHEAAIQIAHVIIENRVRLYLEMQVFEAMTAAEEDKE